MGAAGAVAARAYPAGKARRLGTGARLIMIGLFQQVTTLTKPQQDLLAKLPVPAPKQAIDLPPAIRRPA